MILEFNLYAILIIHFSALNVIYQNLQIHYFANNQKSTYHSYKNFYHSYLENPFEKNNRIYPFMFDSQSY